jgi:hypothetical protein
MFIFKFISNFFRNLYVSIYSWYALSLIRRATKAAAKLMVMSGKDPNYVAPPPAPYVPTTFNDDDINRAWMVDYKNRGSVYLVVDGYYINNPKAHPILRSRKEWEEKLKKAADKLAADKAATVQSAVVEATAAPHCQGNSSRSR